MHAEWVESVEHIGRAAWYRCFSRADVLQDYDLQLAAERSHLPDTSFHYLRLFRDADTHAVFPAFVIQASIALTAPAPIRAIVAKVRQLRPRFLYQHLFVVGSPIAICRDLLGIDPGLSPDATRQVLCKARDEVLAKAGSLGIGCVVLKELTGDALSTVEAPWRVRFSFVESLATTYLPVGSNRLGRYRDRLRKKYRQVMVSRLRRLADSGFRWEKLTRFGPYADDMHRLYLQVRARSEIRFEALTPDFFREIARRLSGRAFVLMCFDGDRPVAFELCLHDPDWVHPLYLGLDYSARDRGALYFNCIYRVIEEVERRELCVVQLGQTSYAAKAGVGALPSRLYLAVSYTNRVSNLLLRLFGRFWFRPAAMPRRQRVFRDWEDVRAMMERLGIPIAWRENGARFLKRGERA